jgi:hypothetical protein
LYLEAEVKFELALAAWLGCDSEWWVYHLARLSQQKLESQVKWSNLDQLPYIIHLIEVLLSVAFISGLELICRSWYFVGSLSVSAEAIIELDCHHERKQLKCNVVN